MGCEIFHSIGASIGHRVAEHMESRIALRDRLHKPYGHFQKGNVPVMSCAPPARGRGRCRGLRVLRHALPTRPRAGHPQHADLSNRRKNWRGSTEAHLRHTDHTCSDITHETQTTRHLNGWFRDTGAARTWASTRYGLALSDGPPSKEKH